MDKDHVTEIKLTHRNTGTVRALTEISESYSYSEGANWKWCID